MNDQPPLSPTWSPTLQAYQLEQHALDANDSDDTKETTPDQSSSEEEDKGEGKAQNVSFKVYGDEDDDDDDDDDDIEESDICCEAGMDRPLEVDHKKFPCVISMEPPVSPTIGKCFTYGTISSVDKYAAMRLMAFRPLAKESINMG